MKFVVLAMLVVAFVHCRPVYSGGPDPREEIPAANGGACWRATSYPINPQQARLRDERGWHEMPFDRRHAIAAKQEVLWVPDYRVCGDPVGELKLHGAWFFRMRQRLRNE